MNSPGRYVRFFVKTVLHEPTLASAALVDKHTPIPILIAARNASISARPHNILSLIANLLGLTVQRVGYKGCMMTSRSDAAGVGVDPIAKSILVLRHQNILLDRDLAALYGVTTKRLNEQVKRNLARFPSDFMFQLTVDEEGALRSHFATSKKAGPNRGGRRYLPYAFTEPNLRPGLAASTRKLRDRTKP